MIQKPKVILFCLFALMGAFPLLGQINLDQPFLETLKGIHNASDAPRVIKGQGDWAFLKAELRHVSKGDLLNPQGGDDPVKAILDFHKQLAQLGIELILLPVPPKVMVYPEKLDPQLEGDTRRDYYHYQLLESLAGEGIEVIDLMPDFLANKAGGQVYCQTDAHWSPLAIEIAAEKVARILKTKDWYPSLPSGPPLEAKESSITFSGDLVEDTSQKETLPIRLIRTEGGLAPRTQEESSLILMGDSHTLVFHAGGDMHAKEGGLVDQLAYELETPLDLIAVRGSGSTASRVNLYRKNKSNPQYLEGKKAVIWCFTFREFTESTSGWKLVPVRPR